MISHEDVPGLMMAMTMMFEVGDRHMLEGLAPDQTVDFRVEHRQGHYRIPTIQPRGP